MRIILMHGNGGGTADDHWFPYVKSELTKLYHEVIAVTFPDPTLARAEYWLPFLEHVLLADQSTILIGHSSGATAAMRYAEDHKIEGSVLVGTYYTDLGYETERCSGYFSAPWNWEAIRNNQRWIIQFASTDDPFIPVEEPRFVHEKLATEYHEYKDQGHFGSKASPMKTFPNLVEVLSDKFQSDSTYRDRDAHR